MGESCKYLEIKMEIKMELISLGTYPGSGVELLMLMTRPCSGGLEGYCEPTETVRLRSEPDCVGSGWQLFESD